MTKRNHERPYGIAPVANGSWRARVPRIRKEDGYINMYFGKEAYDDPEAEAEIWVNVEGIKLWGPTRWEMICDGQLTRLRSENHGVSVRYVVQTNRRAHGGVAQYGAWMVYWRDRDGAERAKAFSPSHYSGFDDLAQEAAELFACHKRAETTGGVLNLPDHWFRF